MAKDITLYSPDGSTMYYPKTVSNLVYNNENGKTVAEELDAVKDVITYTELLNEITSNTLYNDGYYFFNADGTIEETSSIYAVKKYDVSDCTHITIQIRTTVTNVKRCIVSTLDSNGDITCIIQGGAKYQNGIKVNIDVTDINEIWVSSCNVYESKVYNLKEQVDNVNPNFVIGNCNIDITDYFINGYYADCKNTIYVNRFTEYPNTSCISFKVTKGDKFKLENVKAGVGNARAYGVFNKNGELIENATDEYTTKEITIIEDGYINLNTYDGNTGKVYITNISNIKNFKGLEFLTLNADKAVTNKLDKLEEELKNIIKTKADDSADLRNLYFDIEPISYSKDDFSQGFYYTNFIGKLDVLYTTISSWYHLFIDVKPNEEYYLKLTGGNSARAWALLDEGNNIIEYCETGVGNLETNIIIPNNGATKLLVQTQNIYNYSKVQRLENLSRVTALENTVNSLDLTKSETMNIEFDSNKYVYSGVIGSEPVLTSNNSYKCVRIDDVRKGDKFDYSIFCGSSFDVWIALKDNKVVKLGGKFYKLHEGSLECDGTFDSVIFNCYYPEKKDTLTYTYSKPKTDLLETKTENLENRVTELENKTPKKSIKVLCFGNSFTQDSMCYVPHIMKNIAPDVELTLGIAYIGGCPLVQHYVNFSGEESTLDGKTYTVTNYLLHKSVNGSAWSNTSLNVDGVLNNDDWDIITFQQNGGSAARDFNTYYAPYIYKIHKLLFNKLGGKSVKLGWIGIHGTYASTDETILAHYNGVIANTKIIENTTGVSVIFPFGTAIQNLRTIEEIKNLGDTKYLLADGGHLQDGLGCLCAAYCNALKILECIGINNIGVIGEPTRITIDFLNEINTQGRNLGESNTVIGMDNEQYIYLAQIAAHKAIQKPYEITDLNSCNV